jgi:hypothetical protein
MSRIDDNYNHKLSLVVPSSFHTFDVMSGNVDDHPVKPGPLDGVFAAGSVGIDHEQGVEVAGGSSWILHFGFIFNLIGKSTYTLKLDVDYSLKMTKNLKIILANKLKVFDDLDLRWEKVCFHCKKIVNEN